MWMREGSLPGFLYDREADLVVVNDAGPIIGMQLKAGIRLFARKNEYEEFFVRTLNEYDDLKRLRAPIEEAVLRFFDPADR